MKKRVFILLITAIMSFSLVAPAFAASRSVKKALGYSNGIRQWTLTSEYYTGGENAEAAGNELKIAAGGEAQYFFYIPFHAVNVEFSFSKAGADFTLYDVMADKSYDVKTDETAYTLEFAPTLYIGEHNFIIRADKDTNVEISSMVFNKNQIMISEHDYELVNMSDEEWAVAAAIILKDDASMIMVNGSRRYIDFDNTDLTPRYYNGSLYLPAHALARMLDAYVEELPDKRYVLIRKMDREFLFAPDICYQQVFGQEREMIDNLVVYADGYAWLPIRRIAEYFGEYVGYKDGYVAMDDNRFYVNNILEDGKTHSFVANNFKPFIITGDNTKNANTYYVAQKAPNASDKNSGSESSPWKTLTHAGEVLKAGDTVIVKEGIYRETLKVKNNGEPGKPISFIAAPGEEVVISAAEEFKDCFIPYKDGMLAAHVGWDLGPTRNQVYYKNETIIEARHPNGPELPYSEQAGLSSNWPTMGDIHVDVPEDMQHATSENVLNQEEKDYWKGGYLMGIWGTAYGVQATKIVGSEKGSLEIEGGSLFQWGTNHDTANQYDFNWAYISGHQNAIDLPGEWVIRGDTLFILPPEGETKDTLTLEIKKRMLVIDLQDNKHINISGFTTIGGGAKLGNSEMCRLDNCHIRYNNHFLYTADPQHGFIEDGVHTNPNGAPLRGEVGFLIGGRDNVVTNCHFDEAAGPGLYVNGLYPYMENLLVEDCGYAGGYPGGIFICKNAWEPYDTPTGGYYLYQSTCKNSGRSVFMRMAYSSVRTPNVLPGHNAYNEYYGSMLTSLDSGIIYTYLTDHGFDRLKTQMHNNIAYNCYDGIDSFIFGIYHDGGTQNIDTYENIVFSTDESIKVGDDVHTAYAELALADCDVWNNIEEATLGHDLIIPEGKDGLKPEHYPYNKPFYAGTLMNEEPYLVNYEMRHEDPTRTLDPNNMLVKKTDDYILAENAQVGGNAWIDENGMARFTKDGDWICFPDVDFGEGKNVVSISYQADPYHLEGDNFEILVDDLNGKAFDMLNFITAESRQSTIGDIRHRKISAYSGYHDVYIRAKDYFSAKITGIRVWEDDLASSKPLDHLVWAGNFDQDEYKVVVEGFASTAKPSEETKKPDGILTGEGPSTWNTWHGSVYPYKDVVVAEDADTFAISSASSVPYAYQQVTLHVGSPDAEPIGTLMTTSDKGFSNYVVDKVKLTEILPAGTYDLYLKFTSPGTGDQGYIGKSCNFKYFCVYNESVSSIIPGRDEPR